MFAVRHLRTAAFAAVVSVAANAGPAPAQQASTITRRLWVGKDYQLLGSPSPDNRLMSYLDLHFDLAVRDLVTGRSRRLTFKGPKDSSDYGGSSVFSPDSRRIAYAWETGEDTICQLRVIATDSGAPKVIYQLSTRTAWLAPSDWAPNGRFVVTTVTGNAPHGQIILVPAAGGDARVVKTFETWRSAGAVRISPDGAWLAYDYPPYRDEGRREIRILSVDGRRESTVVKVASTHDDSHLIGWTPDGSRIVFNNEDHGAPAIWSLRVASGKAQGSPTLVRGDMWRATGLRLTPRGNLYYFVNTGDQDVFAASYDPVSGRLSDSISLTGGKKGEDYAVPSWSPNGRFISYLITGQPGVPGASTVSIRSTGGAPIQDLHPNVVSLSGSAWTLDTKALVLRAVDPAGRDALFRLDLSTGDVVWLARGTRVMPALSGDGRELYYVPDPQGSGPQERRFRLLAHDLATGKERELYVAPEGTRILANKRIVTSPDGKHVLVLTAPGSGRSTQIQIVDVRGGQPYTVVLQETQPSVARPPTNLVGFSPDGRFVLFTAFRVDEAGGRPAVWRVPISGGKPEQILGEIRGNPRLSPDGRRVAWVAGGISHELWVLEDPRLRSTVVSGSSGRSQR